MWVPVTSVLSPDREDWMQVGKRTDLLPKAKGKGKKGKGANADAKTAEFRPTSWREKFGQEEKKGLPDWHNTGDSQTTMVVWTKVKNRSPDIL